MSNSSDPMDCNLLGSSVHGILQAGILEWVAISFSRGEDQGIFLTPELIPSFLHCRQILYWLNYVTVKYHLVPFSTILFIWAFFSFKQGKAKISSQEILKLKLQSGVLKFSTNISV